MKNIIGALILLLAGSLLIACNGDGDASAAASQVSFGRQDCSGERGDAISIVLLDEDRNPLDNVKVSYSKNGGPMQVHSERASGSDLIRETGGSYYIEALKRDYRLESALVIVPYDESCSILKQEVTFTLRPTACNANGNLFIRIDGLSGGDVINMAPRFPVNNDQPARQCSPGECEFNIALTNPGIYEVSLTGFSDIRSTHLDNNTFRNEYPSTQIVLHDGIREHIIASEGLGSIKLMIPFKLGKSGCNEVHFEEITADPDYLVIPEVGFGGIHEHSNLDLNDLASPECTAAPVPKTVFFGVDVPAGTTQADIRVEYWFEGDWQEAECYFDGNQYVCSADYTNPLLADKYHVRTIIDGDETVGAYIPLWNKCITFENPSPTAK